MKSLSSKLVIGFITLLSGIAIVWVSGNFHPLTYSFFKATAPPAENVVQISEPPFRVRSGKVQLHFTGFEPAKDWIADFEIVNDTEQPIIYIGYPYNDKFSYCTLAVRRFNPFKHSGHKTRDNCLDAPSVSLQTIEPGRSLKFSIFQYEVRELLHLGAAEQKVNAQVGFEVFVGEGKRREMLWSEEITFPNDESSN
jgi:hypothetical protein